MIAASLAVRGIIQTVSQLKDKANNIDNLFSRFFERPETSLGAWLPRIETYRKDNEYIVRLDLPGG